VDKKIKILLFCTAPFLLFGCKKKATQAPAKATVSAGAVLSSEASIVIAPMYVTLANNASLLYNGTIAFQSAPTQQNLANCRQLWLNASAAYEQSAATLFGAGGSLGADPASLINTYPIDTAGINQLISGNTPAAFTLDFIDSLPTYLTGFHGIEFELYGIKGNKTASEFTASQLSYIAAVALNIKTLTSQVDSAWNGPFQYQFAGAGSGSMIYPDQRAAFSDLTMAIANICETDAIYKLDGILINKSTILQESPFANNSVNDIVNNLVGVRNLYYGQYGGYTGTGLTAFVYPNGENLDVKIKADLNIAITAVSSITQPLSQAIYTQNTQINTAISACDSLDDDLKVDLLTYLNKYTN